ncbi:MAG: cytochrome C oxidase subunit IV family protein [Bryobacterales bacterium]|nr:cytochrome C oxidase subunit IV family protein [Bryobacterales bacterium]MBV9401055.1 cytochrome C oxidase subunit IV family protein [Bryobacterales bacterium]
MAQPAVSRKTYAYTFGGLLALTALTTLLGFIDMGPMNVVVAVGIAAVKASLIAAFFMHALYEGKLVRVALAGGVIWFLILVSLTITDYIGRRWS